MRLLTYLQKTKGISRRDFLDMIKEKVVYVNDKLVDNIYYSLKLGDKLKIVLPNGEIYAEKIEKFPIFRPIIIVFNKPKGYVVSKSDKFNKTIFEFFPSSWKKDFYYIGRLDKNSRGLQLLTNDPKLVDRFANPKNKVIKIYNVQINKPFSSKDIKLSKKGVYVDENGQMVDLKKLKDNKNIDFLSFYDVSYNKENGKHFLRILLTEGRKRHIRRLLKALGYKVLDLQRIKFGKYSLGNIKEGKYRIYKV